ncbi:P-loop containing nucleoside triphosphate hydrolase protein [Mycena rosella]|uniref:DNA 3'-5' helicase n=1 Tax=Mycena rosella TaxID=1033263 RepID=A0AAD7C9I1_MYCRO|nr:P-loop containing nucleoside triphosphate hydrolase protein [Mycena rosella]
MDHLYSDIPLPMSISSLDAFKALPRPFMSALTPPERLRVLEAFMYLDFASKGTKLPRDLQLRAYLAVKAGNDLLVRSGTGSGKTLAMILPVVSLPKGKVVITVSPLRLIQDNHVVEFTKYGIPSIAINSYTSDDPALWKSIKNHSVYRHYSASPEQCGPFQGHIPRFAKLLHDPKWVKHVAMLQIDEAQKRLSETSESVFVCTSRLRQPAPHFRPTVKLELTTNRPNLVRAVIPMIGSINNFTNLHFLIPTSCPPNFVLPKSMVFLDNKRKAAQLARYLNAQLPPALALRKPFRHYHSPMSKHYLEDTVDQFKGPAGDVRCLIATESASNGFDVPDISLIVLFGVPKTEFEDDQRGGRVDATDENVLF